MSILVKSLLPFSISSSLDATVPCKVLPSPASSSLCELQQCGNPNRAVRSSLSFVQSPEFLRNYSLLRATHIVFCHTKDVSRDLTNIQMPQMPQNEGGLSNEDLELLNKPSPIPINGGSSSQLESKPLEPRKDAALEPFLKFFKPKDSEEEQVEEGEVGVEKESEKVVVEYYEPKPGDFVVGVVVSGNENKLDVNVGADLLGTMLTKEVLPLYDKEMDFLVCDLDRGAGEFMANGKMGIVQNPGAISGKPVAGRPVVDPGTVLFAEVLGRTLSGRPLLSTRRLFRRIAWHRVRQIKHLDEPIEVRITEWNTGGLLTRIEGLRAFLPKAELVYRMKSFADLKERVGSWMYVQIARINEANNDLVISEREAWEKLYLREGALLEGTVRKIFPYGAQVKIGQTNRIGLLHVSNITDGKINSVSDLLAVGEKVKVLVVRSLFPGKISLSIADLESEPGLFISDKQRVFAEAEQMARKYRQKLPPVSAPHKSQPPPPKDALFDDEAKLYANWKWFEFLRGKDEPDTL